MQSLMFLGCFGQKLLKKNLWGGRLDPPGKGRVKESCGDNSVTFNKQTSPSDIDISERQNSFHFGMCNYLPCDTADMHRVRLQFQTNHR